MGRSAEVNRITKETKISCRIDLDGSGEAKINTGIGFFDHMLNSFAKHGLLDLELTADGDLEVDNHHTVEDVGIVLGQAIREAIGDKAGINRFGSSFVPLDESLAHCVIDLSGRPYLVFQADFPVERVGSMETETVKEFFYALSYSAMMNINIRVIDGVNAHHMMEAMFKACGRALCEALAKNPRIKGIPSTKGVI